MNFKWIDTIVPHQIEKPQKAPLDLGKKYVETYSWSNTVAPDSVERPALPAKLLEQRHYVIYTVRTYSDYQRKNKTQSRGSNKDDWQT